MGAPRLLLVGWDAADWKVIRPLMAAGKMPNIARLVAGGASGQIATLHPPLSPMLWTSIATGKRPFRHGIHGFSEPAPDGSGVRPVTNLSRKSKALWNILSQSGLRSIVIGWWPSHPAEPIDGVMVSDQYHRAGGPIAKGWPLAQNTIHPPALAETLAALRVHPDRLTPAMIEPFVPLAREIDQEKDKRLAALLRTLAECMSIDAAARWLIENHPWDFFAVYFDSIDHFSHSFMRYHPPRQAWIGERDFELYRNVVATGYQLQDQMLGSLMRKAGEDTTVILLSDHGFHPDHLRPSSIPDIPAGPAIEHRDFGVFAIGGPDIRRGAIVNGASLLDITPTILTLYGLTVGEDMDGKVLAQVFERTPKINLVSSWESIAGADGRHPPHTLLDPMAAHAAMEQMIALGYIERPDADRERAIENTVRELRYNLAESYQDAGRHAEAREILEELCRADPDEQRFAVRLFVSCQALDMRREMRRIVEDLDGRRRALFQEAKENLSELARQMAERDADSLLGAEERRELVRWRNLARWQPALTDYLKARLLAGERRCSEALKILTRLARGHPERPGLLSEIADLHLRLGHAPKARQIYEQVLAIDPDYGQARLGLCRIALRECRFPRAAAAALEAVERVHHDPVAHFLLGRALVGMKQYERAAEAFRAAISFNPNFAEAHTRLAGLLEARLGDPKAAQEHRRLAVAMKRGVTPAREPVQPATAFAHPSIHREDNQIARPSESLIVVSGLPRSGTSLVMQMLAAGGVAILSDGARAPDKDNPRGYLEFGPVKNLLQNSGWLRDARGKAVKIVAPLLAALPADLPCRVILVERDLDEVLDSQHRMLLRRGGATLTDARRRMLKQEYLRTLALVKSMPGARAATRLLTVDYSNAIADPRCAAETINRFLGGGLNTQAMAAAVDPSLYRNRAGETQKRRRRSERLLVR